MPSSNQSVSFQVLLAMASALCAALARAINAGKEWGSSLSCTQRYLLGLPFCVLAAMRLLLCRSTPDDFAGVFIAVGLAALLFVLFTTDRGTAAEVLAEEIHHVSEKIALVSIATRKKPFSHRLPDLIVNIVSHPQPAPFIPPRQRLE